MLVEVLDVGRRPQKVDCMGISTASDVVVVVVYFIG
jgi:hypothetical protein